MMLEGMSVRAIERLTGMHSDTILSLMNTAAESPSACSIRMSEHQPQVCADG